MGKSGLETRVEALEKCVQWIYETCSDVKEARDYWTMLAEMQQALDTAKRKRVDKSVSDVLPHFEDGPKKPKGKKR